MPATAVCPECNGTGYKIVQRDEVSGAVRCSCVGTDRAERIEGNAQIPPLYSNASFDNFLLPRDNQIQYRELTEVFLAVRGYARDFPNVKKPGLLLIGDPGGGKTHLAVAALRTIISKGVDGLFIDYVNLLDRIRSGFDAASNVSDKEVYRIAMDKEVLLLDDLGAHRVSDWVEDTITSIITARCNQRKALIATTNLIDPEMYTIHEAKDRGLVYHRTTIESRIGPRARSRLFEMCRVIRVNGIDDFRLRKKGDK